MQWSRALVGLAAAGALAGCGTTVSGTEATSQSGALNTGAADTLSVPSAGAVSSVTGPIGSRGDVATGTTSSGSATVPAPATSTGSTAVATGGGSAGVPVGSGAGVTAAKIYLGVTYYTNGDAAAAALGESGITQGDTKADAQAAIDDVNAHGGILGRKIAPVWHAFNETSQETKASQDEAACADFTQDNHVYAVAGSGLSDDLRDCLTKHGVLNVDSGEIIDADNTDFAQHPNYFNLGTLAQDRMMAEMVRTLDQMHYFTGWNTALGQPSPKTPVKLGIMTVDVPSWERPLDHVFLPALHRLGYSISSSDIIRVHNPESAGEDGTTVSQIENAVLKFRQDGVTHELLLDASGSFLQFQGPVARSQHYYPRYGINSASGMEAIYESGAVMSDQLTGAVGVGWLPSLDLPANASGKYATATTRRCLAVIKRETGQTFSSTNAASLALSFCDEIYSFAAALNQAAPTSVTLETGISAMESLGSGYVPAGLPTAFLGPGRHDAAQVGFDLTWDTACPCAKYVSKAFRIP